MRIKAKLYPYPVLANAFNDDYLDSTFDIELKQLITDNELILLFTPILENEGLKRLIEENKAIFVMHVECIYTCFRKAFIVPANGLKTSIPADRIEGVLHLCPYIVAKQNIKSYANEKFNKEYGKTTFDLDKGNTLAIGYEKIIKIEKERDDLVNLPSIFSVTEIKDELANEIIIDYSKDKLGVRLPTKVYKQFISLNSNIEAQAVLHALITVPTLMKCLEELKQRVDCLYEYENRRWFRVLNKTVKKFGMELNENTIPTIDSFVLSQKIMDNATSRGIVNLNKIAFEGGGIDED